MHLAQCFSCVPNPSGRAGSLVAIAVVLSVGTLAVAQPEPERVTAPQTSATQPAETSYWLRVTGDGVNLRSRADLNSRIVGRVNRDDVLEAVGREYDWQRIVPPAGVYSLVSASYVERRGPRRGIVRVNTTLRVRVGSDIQPRDPMVSEVQTRLPPDAEVEIVGELDGGWLKIVPPPGVRVYVSDDLVARITAAEAQRLRAAKTTYDRSGDLSHGSRPSSRPAARTQPSPQRAATSRPTEPPELTGRSGREQDAARHARELEKSRPQAEERTAPPAFDARGVLRPSFALPAGPYGLRYSLQDPFTHAVQAYVEFPTELGLRVQACLGKYVGVRGKQQPAKGLSVALLRVTHMTVLNPDGPTTRPAREKP